MKKVEKEPIEEQISSVGITISNQLYDQKRKDKIELFMEHYHDIFHRNVTVTKITIEAPRRKTTSHKNSAP